MKNIELAKILNNIADILELQEVEFKPNAYRKAARSIEELSEDITEIEKRGEIKNIPGVGESIAEKIAEFIKTGKIYYYEQLKKTVDLDFESLNQIPGLGPKKIKILYQKLAIRSVLGLEKALKSGKVSKLAGFGPETEKNLLQGIDFFKTKPKRYLYAQIAPIVQEALEHFRKLSFVQKIEVAGSFRRGKETIGDIDLLAISQEPRKVVQALVQLPEIKEVLAQGETKGSVRLRNGLQIDLRVVAEKEFGSALQYFIGNKEHNIELRKLALSKGYTLSEYGLFTVKEKKWLAGRTEEDIYHKLGLQWIEPELREATGEIAAAQKKLLPKIITAKYVHGIFHNHSTWSDGENSLLQMAQKAEQLGMKFISFNDHFGSVAVANPIPRKNLDAYLQEIETVRQKVGIRVFSGLEIDILKNGKLPLAASKLKEFDIVIAAIHLSQKMPEAEMTARVCSALENYPIHILGHPTCRLLNSRPPINLNLEKVFEVAKHRNVFLEINAEPPRMDLDGMNVKAALQAGCKVAIGTDAHDLMQLENYKFGVLCARRGWAEKKDVLNCWNLPQIEKYLKK